MRKSVQPGEENGPLHFKLGILLRYFTPLSALWLGLPPSLLAFSHFVHLPRTNAGARLVKLNEPVLPVRHTAPEVK